MNKLSSALTGICLAVLCSSVQAGDVLDAADSSRISDADVQTLTHMAQLQAYWQMDLTLAQSVCIQERIGPTAMTVLSHGARDGAASVNARLDDSLRRAREQCVSLSVADADTRLVKEARVRYQDAVMRLQLPLQQLKLCREEASAKGGPQACLQRVLGRTPTDVERQWLLVLASTYRP